MLRLIHGGENENNNGFGGNGFGAGGDMSLAACTFTGSTFGGNDLGEDQDLVQKYGNYRGTRHLIVQDKGATLILGKAGTQETIEVSACNVSDISASPTSKEKICPGDNQCRRDGLMQGPNCQPITPEEGRRLLYPHPLGGRCSH